MAYLQTRGWLRLRSGRRSFPMLIVVIAWSAAAQGQEWGAGGEVKREVTVVPRISVSETFTDNVSLVASGKKAAMVTDISPGIHIARDGGRFKGHVDYAVHGIGYSNGAAPSRSQRALDLAGVLEALDSWMYVDFSGVISQQTLSALGTQSRQDTVVNANTTEMSSYQMAPYVRGRLGDSANYEARYSRALTFNDSAARSNVAVSHGSVYFAGDSAFKNIGWLVNADRQGMDYSAGRSTEIDRVGVGLSYTFAPQWGLRLAGGREDSNLTSTSKQTYDNSSWGLDWSPSDRTTASVSAGRRSFGDSHAMVFTHRTARTVWGYTDTRDLTAMPSQTTFLRAMGVPGAPVIGSFVSSAVVLQRRRDLYVSLLGVRDTITLVATESESSRADTLSTAADDLTTSTRVVQRGFSAAYAHRLTMDCTLQLSASQQRTVGQLAVQEPVLHEVVLSVASKVGRSVSAGVGVRRSVFSGVSPYDESAVTINMNAYF